MHQRKTPLLLTMSLSLITLISCGGSSDEQNDAVGDDAELRNIIQTLGLTGDPTIGRTLPDINDPLPQLGKLLFFSKSLGGDFDSACVTCHHPTLGGTDNLALPVGTGAVNANLLGEGRTHQEGLPLVPRNSPTVFNIAFNDSGLFWDSRVESLGKEFGANGADSGIRTPDTPLGTSDIAAGENLTTAQARFPVTSTEEMKGDTFENGSTGDEVREHLAARIGNYGIGTGELSTNLWLNEFQTAFASTESAENLITFDNIAHAIGEYERSMIFVDNPWKAYVDGNNNALTEQQKEGAILFFTSIDEDGGGCFMCHSGDAFSDGLHHTIAFPQIGPGKGDGNNDDFGRERETNNANDRYKFRTPSLLNVAVTAPFGHAGAYDSLQEVLAHYNNPGDTADDYFDDGGWCQLAQFQSINNCASLYPDAEDNTELALDKLQRERRQNTTLFENINLNGNERAAIVAFLQALTDPCVEDRQCLADWIADPTTTGPDAQQLNGIDSSGGLL